ncbi:MAG: ATP cone domain-containing protein [Thermoleophilia bacterium]|nr:ATP cone domain-containing protein [Thermoleophilia bacterium]
MANKPLRIYLAGPISGCNEEQKTWWRAELKRQLHGKFDFEDPAEWTNDFAVSREIGCMESCDIIVANMWKESIGTTLSIIRGRQQGKPVILIDPNHLSNPVLNSLVEPEKPVHSLEEACTRLQQMAAQFRPFLVIKKDGTQEEFSARKLAQSVARAAAAAGVHDTALEEHIAGPVIARLRREGSDQGVVDTDQIRRTLLERLEWMSVDPGNPRELRNHVRAILNAWQQYEVRKVGDRALQEALERVTALEAECQHLRQELATREARIRELERNPIPEPAPAPSSLVEALQCVARQYSDCVVVHEQALESAAASPYRDVAKAWEALQLLGRYARERQVKMLTGDRFVGTREWFKAHKDEVPGLSYASHEGEITKGKHGFERTVVHEKVKLLAEQHLRLGDSHDPQKCLRIYFAVHQDKVIVAHCGRHLSTALSG